MKRVKLENTDITILAHEEDLCIGEFCTIHNRSDHSMRKFPQHWRGDRGIMERICTHGIGHPDPDEYKLTLNEYEGIHGCDGCCSEDYVDPNCTHENNWFDRSYCYCEPEGTMHTRCDDCGKTHLYEDVWGYCGD